MKSREVLKSMKNKGIWIVLLVVIFAGILRLYIIEHDLPDMLPHDFRCSVSTNGIVSFHLSERRWMQALLVDDALLQPPSEMPLAVYTHGPFTHLMFKAFKKFGQALHLITFLPEKYLYTFHPEELVSALLFFRTFNLILTMATLYLVFLLGKRLYNYRTGLLAAFMLSIFPGHIVYAKIVNSDIPALFWTLLSMIFLFNVVKSGRLKWYILGGITSSLAFHSKANAAPVFLLLPLAHLLFCWGKKIRFRDVILNRNLRIGLISVLLSWVILMPYLWLDPKHFLILPGPGVKKSLLKVDKLLPSLGFFLKKTKGYYFQWLRYEAGYPIFYLGLLGVLLALVRRKKADIFLIFYGYFFLVAVQYTCHVGYEAHPSYSTPVFPVLPILASRMVVSFWNGLSKVRVPGRTLSHLRQLLRVSFLLVFIGLMLFQLAIASACIDWLSQPDPRRQVADWIDKNLPTETTLGSLRHQLATEHQLINRFKYNWQDFRFIPDRKTPTTYDNTKDYLMGFDSKYVIAPWDAIEFSPAYKYLLRPGPDGYRRIKRFELKQRFFWSNFIFNLYQKHIYSHYEREFLEPCVEVLEKRGKGVRRTNIYNDLYHYFQKDQSIFRIYLYPICHEGYERYIIERRDDRWFDVYQIRSIRKLAEGLLPIKSIADLMNIKYLVFSSPVEIPRLHFEERITDGDQAAYIYRNLDFSPRAYDLLNRGNDDNIQIREYSTDKIRIALDTEGPGLLLINELPLPYWTVYLNGKRGKALETDLPFFIVPFNRYTTSVELRFKTGRFGKAKARLLFVGAILLIAVSAIFIERRIG